MSEIFISYSRIDEPFVSQLVGDLERASWDLFYDRKLLPAQNYVEVLAQELQQAKYVLVVLSPNSLASSEVLKELRTALQLEHEERTMVVPLLIEPCDPQTISRVMGSKVYADFTVNYDIGFKELSRILIRPKPVPTPPPVVEPKPNGGGNKITKHQKIVIALIAAIVPLITAYWQFVYKPSPPPDSGPIQYTGRVTDSASQLVIHGAKVSVETAGVPQVYYTDSDGIFYVKLPISAGGAAHIRVEADGYQTFDRNVSLSRTGTEEVPLTAHANKDSSEKNRNSGSSKGSPKTENTNSQKKIDRILKSASANKPT